VDPEELDPSGCCSEPVVSGSSSDSLERVDGEITSGEKYSDEWVILQERCYAHYQSLHIFTLLLG